MGMVELITYWLAVVLYAASFALFTASWNYRKSAWAHKAYVLCQAAFSLHTAAMAVRWAATGHPPFVAFFESVTAAAWFTILAYLVLTRSSRGMHMAGMIVTGAVFVLLGWASMPSYAGETLAPGLRSVWLFIHASFATAAVGLFLVAAAMSLLWLYRRNHSNDRVTAFELPTPEIIDEKIFRYILMGFLFYTIMLISGAIWANNAWGRYWGWDPIETWSLISWLVYGLYLHLHSAYKRLRGAFTAWYAVVAVAVAAFSLWGVGFVYRTIHNYG